MKLPIRWAQSFAPFTAEAQAFADAMTMSGSKVETFESEADHMKNVVIGRVESLARHADSDHLWVCQVNVGSESLQIVTGAQNLKAGDVCPVALHGAVLPNGTEIRRGKLRGVQSSGMLCSLPELGLSVHDFPDATEDGILVLDENLVPGTDAAAALGMDEVVFDFEITPNRPDCLSVRGLAREAAATFKVPFEDHTPAPPAGAGDVAALLRVKVDSTDTCLRYSAAVVENVRIAPSPRWMRERLRHAGVRPINNIVDITNYVMLEYGQPMHAFDHAYVNGAAITVRKAKPGEIIVTLDGTERTLDTEMMVIADEKGPIAVAGVMGGEFSGVYDTTHRVVFESASFDGPSVRATSRRLNLRTESSTRFEKGLDPNLAGPALRRALELVAELNAGDIVGGILDDYPAPRQARTIPLRADAVNGLLGTSLPQQQMVDILLPLGFEVNGEQITVPTARADVSRDCDIAEEVARFVGYNNMPSTVLRGAAAARPTPRQRFDEACVSTLMGCGLWQCQTFSFYSPKLFDKMRLPQSSPLRNAVKIMNPLGEETSIMRTTALPSLLEVAARNWAARADTCAVFEQATEYLPAAEADALPTERQKLILVAYGPHWDYAGIKGAVEALLARSGIADWEVRRNSEGISFHPGRCAEVWVPTDGGTALLCTLGEVHPAVSEAFDIRPRVVAADVDMDLLFAVRGGTPQYRPLPKYPALTRDLALVADDALPAAEIAAVIRAAGGSRLESLTLFDVYTGEKLGAGKKSLAYSLVLRDAGATLTDADADAIIAKVLKNLEKLGVQLRS
ncbi:MAG: phenylalanine--tRNA ligase subunit beta [Oscillospiraceae bacterium]